MIGKYIKSACISCMVLSTIVSCNVMDTKPFESYSEEFVWGSYATAESFVLATYPSIMDRLAGGSAEWESMTPNGAQCDQVSPGVNGIATEIGIDSYHDAGFGKFGEQRRCNLIIEKAAGSTVFTPEEKILLTAEAHFLRGVICFEMTRKMGRFVRITKVLEPGDLEEFKTPLTKDVAESYKYVMEDLDIACRDLPSESILGRANKYVALAIRSRVALQAYAYTKDAKYLDVAINSANEVVNDGGYTLTSNYGGLFNEESPNDGEIIMARYYLDSDAEVVSFPEMILVNPNLPNDEVAKGSKDGVSTLKPTQKTFDGWGFYWPTQDLVDQYLVIDEATNQAVEWHESSQARDNVDLGDVNTLAAGSIEIFERHDGEKRLIPTTQDMSSDRTDYPLFKHYVKVKNTSTRNFTELFYGNRDKRMDATIVRDLTKYQDENIETNTGGNASQGIRIKPDGGWYTTTTGYYWRKSTVKADPRVFYATKINMHFVIARLGEMYMNLAEAYLLKGEIANAVAALNETRTTHGGLSGAIVSTPENAWKDYIRERRVEMAYENADIYFSYLRWGKYGSFSNYGRDAGDVIKDLDSPTYKIMISSDRKQAVIGQLTLLDSENRKFSQKRYLFPIPQGQIDKRTAGGIIDTPNPGW